MKQLNSNEMRTIEAGAGLTVIGDFANKVATWLSGFTGFDALTGGIGSVINGVLGLFFKGFAPLWTIVAKMFGTSDEE